MSKFLVSLVAIIALLVDRSLCKSAVGDVVRLSVGEANGFRGELNHNKPSSGNASQEAPDKFITAGKPTVIGQYPWAVYFTVKFADPRGTMVSSCGGSLISSRHIITAAHCVDFKIVDYEDVSIYLGEYNTATFPKDCVGRQCVKNVLMHPANINIHSGYQSRPLIVNDIAMMTLRVSAPNTDYIRPISLPSFNINTNKYEGTPLIVTGWGHTERGQASPIKLHAQVNQVTPNTCRRYVPVTKGILCAASGKGQGICFGDSGGPVMVQHERSYQLVGIMSFIIDKCGSSKPSMYTNVYSYLDWIQNSMRE